MNKHDIKSYWHLLEAMREGREIQMNAGTKDDPHWETKGDYWFSAPPSFYRIKPLSFPSLPDGEEWHNPDGLTPEQVGAGFRLLTKREHRANQDKEIAQFWSVDSWDRRGFPNTRLNSNYSYRVPASTPFLLPPPAPEKRIRPFRLGDNIVGLVVREKGHKIEHMITRVAEVDVVIGYGVPYDVLLRDYECRWPQETTWGTCGVEEPA